MDWTSAAITEVFIATLAVCALGTSAILGAIYVLNSVVRALHNTRSAKRPMGPEGFGVGPIVGGPRQHSG